MFCYFIFNIQTHYTQVASPNITCLSVANNGNVTINWAPTTNVGGSFVQYNIYANTGGSFNLVHSNTSIATSIFIHGVAGAHLGAVSYYITSVYTDGTSNIEAPAIDTISSVYLNLNNPNDGTAILQWNDPISPLSAGSIYGNYYYIHQEYPMGTWTLIDSVHINNTNYKRDTISVCQSILNYRIELKNNANCSFFSNIKGDEFRDLIAPFSPVLQQVSVDTATGNSIITWHPSISPDAIAYIILINVNGGWIILDTVHGYNNTTYTYTNSNSSLISEPYGIAAYDSCLNGNPPGPNTSPMGIPNKTIYLKTAYKVCKKEITLTHNKYINWQSGVSKYEIYKKTGNGNFVLVQTNASTDTLYTDVSIQYNVNYCYFVKAISGNLEDTSFSNITCRYSNQPPIPNFSYLSNVTIENNVAEIDLYTHTGGITKKVILERSNDNGITYKTIETRNSIQNNMNFIDSDALVAQKSYQYRIALIDSCENISRITNIGKNIVLSVNVDNANLKNLLQWNAYDNWQLGVAQYEIYRSVNGIFDSNPIAIVGANQLYYEDDVAPFIGTNANGEFCYRIAAKELQNSFGNSATSKSNEVCSTIEPLIFVPNALILNGINNSWKPVVNMLNFDSYTVRVYTRFGEVIFETTNPYESWDGHHKGKPVQVGVYIYQVTFDAGNGKFEDVRGPITVVR